MEERRRQKAAADSFARAAGKSDENEDDDDEKGSNRRKGQESITQGLDVFPIHGPKWPKEHSPGFTPGSPQGSPWVGLPPEMSPEAEGAGGFGENRLRTSELDRVQIWPIQGKNAYFGLPRVNPELRFPGS
jgi:hypothetical protein